MGDAGAKHGVSALEESKRINTKTLRLEAAAKQWAEALPVGNGRLGAMVFGGIQPDCPLGQEVRS